MTNEVCTFNGNKVSFLLEKENEMMINATEMAKIFGRQVNEFMSNETTKSFISECFKNGNSRFLGIENEEDLFVSKQKSGTWMHRVLALKFAAWLDPAFEIWVYCTIEDLLFGRHLKREQSFERTIALQKEMDELISKPNKKGDDFDRYLEIQRSLKHEVAIRKSLTIEGLYGMKSLF